MLNEKLRTDAKAFGNRVTRLTAAVNELLNILGELASCSPFGRQSTNLVLGGDLAGEQEPEKTLGQRLGATWSLWQLLLAFWDLNTVRVVPDNMKG